jgi:two-component sensor histidine kinase
MPSVYLPYINIALDSFALVVTLIIFAACFCELSRKTLRARHFLVLLCSVVVALIADIVSWVVEGNISMYFIIVISNTVAMCAAHIAVISFMGYLKENLYQHSIAAEFIVKLFRVLCALSLVFCIGNAFGQYSLAVDAHGHWDHTDSVAMGILYMLFPILSFLALILMAAFAKNSTRVNRIAFVIYTLLPVVGIIIDYTVHGISLSYVCITLSLLIIYTSIYINKRKLVEAQKNALMLSQINPHFVYNTLSTIASMCDVSPNQAKHLTIEFSRYLRQNIYNLSAEELIDFEQELNHVECYLKIEKARFRERLNVVYAVQCKDFRIPPLSIQPLVENAVKHGVTKKAEGGTIKISTYETDTSYVIDIKDNGVGFDVAAADMHVGIENVKSRVEAICKGSVTVKSTIGVGTRVTIEIPKKRGKRR